MMSALVNYGLSGFLGFTLFVGIAGRLNPFARPHYLQDRASWYLGLWVGLSVTMVGALCLHLTNGAPIGDARALLLPTASLLACMILSCLALLAVWHYRTAKAPRKVSSASVDWLPSNDNQKTSVNDAPDAVYQADVEDESGNIPEIDRELSDQLAHEITLREETENHLRITRKALSILESDTRHYSLNTADAVIDLEEKLADSIAAASIAEARAIEEKARRLEMEQRVIDLKQKMIDAKQEIRRAAAARAKALSTANKSIAFARQSVEIRTRLEAEMTEARITIKNRRKTISSLIKALEREKRKNQEAITASARQMVQQEKQVKARNSLEAVARSVENKLNPRLVKKVAKARPLQPEMQRNIQQGKPG